MIFGISMNVHHLFHKFTPLAHLPMPHPLSTPQRPGTRGETRGETRGSRDSAPCGARTSAAWAAAPQAPDSYWPWWTYRIYRGLRVSKAHPESSSVPIFLDDVHWSSQAAGWFCSWSYMTMCTQRKNVRLHRHKCCVKFHIVPRLVCIFQETNCFASSDPHHGIQVIPSDILSGKSSGILSVWHSIWHIFWHSIWHIFWHSVCRIFWHSIWHIFWHSICNIFRHSIWHIFWHSILHSISQAFWHSIWHIFWHSICNIFWHSIWYIFWHSIWHIFWHSIWLCFWPLRSGWGPARPTPRRISPVEVRRGAQCSDSHRLRSGEAHSAPTLTGWSPARRTVLRLSPVEVRRGAQCSDSRRLRSSEAHCDRELAIRAGRWGPARTTDQELAVEIWRGPLRSRAGRWGPARPTAIKSWQMRSGEDHCDQELAVEIRRGPLDQELADELRRGGRRTRRRRNKI